MLKLANLASKIITYCEFTRTALTLGRVSFVDNVSFMFTTTAMLQLPRTHAHIPGAPKSSPLKNL